MKLNENIHHLGFRHLQVFCSIRLSRAQARREDSLGWAHQIHQFPFLQPQCLEG